MKNVFQTKCKTWQKDILDVYDNSIKGNKNTPKVGGTIGFIQETYV